MARPDNSLLIRHMAHSVAPDHDVPRFGAVERSIHNGAYRYSPDLMQDEALLKSGFRIEVQALRDIHNDPEMKKKINMTFGARLDTIERSIDSLSKPAQEIGKLKNDIADLEAEKAALIKTNQDNLAEIAKVSQMKDDVTDNLSKANDTLAELRREDVDQNAQIVRLKKDLSDAEDKIDRLSTLLAIPPVKKPPVSPPVIGKVTIEGLPSNSTFVNIMHPLAHESSNKYILEDFEPETPYETALDKAVFPGSQLKRINATKEAFAALINLNIERYKAIRKGMTGITRDPTRTYIDTVALALIYAYKKIAAYDIPKKLPPEWKPTKEFHIILLLLMHVDYLIQFWASKGISEFSLSTYEDAVQASVGLDPDDKIQELYTNLDNLLHWYQDTDLQVFDVPIKEDEILDTITRDYIKSAFDEDSDSNDSDDTYFVQFMQN